MKQPQYMGTSISRAPYPGLGHCTVCGRWTNLEMWDDGLAGRFCLDCFDYVVDAEQFLANQLQDHSTAEGRQQTPEIFNEGLIFRRYFWKRSNSR